MRVASENKPRFRPDGIAAPNALSFPRRARSSAADPVGRLGPDAGTDAARSGRMTPTRAFWMRAGALVVLAGSVACGSVSPLGHDGGGGTGGSTTGAAGSTTTGSGGSTTGSGGSTTTGAAGNQGTAGSKTDAGADGAAGATHDAGADRAPTCPAAFTTLAEGAACPVPDGVTCDYGEGRCGCLPCSTSTTGGASTIIQGYWSCRAWGSGGQGCPPMSPPVGSACNVPNQFCTYGGFCSISVGDDLECAGGTWQRMISALGTCALHMCASSGGHPPDKCSGPDNCPGGACWLQLDGSKACVSPRTSPGLMTCQTGDSGCCSKDGDCTQGSHGRCLPLIDVKENFCGGAVPIGNVCRYDQCATDADCKAGMPAGTTVATCLPSGALNTLDATCAYGVCRTDADCTLHPGGNCQYGQAATHGVCSLRNVLFCAYPSDPCGNASSQPCGSPMICVPNDNLQGRVCGQGPPQYP
jgi:hypothetical protein